MLNIRSDCLNIFLVLLSTLYVYLSWNGEAYAYTRSSGLPVMEAVASAFKYSPDILLKDQEVLYSKGSLQQYSGQFDLTFELGTSYSDLKSPVASELDQDVKNISNSFQVSKQLRNGITLNSSVSLSQIETTYSYQSATETEENSGAIFFTVVIPLLKGRGTEAAAAYEMAAEVNLEIAELQSRNTISQTAMNTILAYWSYRAAFEELNQYEQSEKRAEESLRITQAMITADQAPASLLENAKAKLSSKRSARIQARQALYEAQQALGIMMGIDLDSIELLPFPSDPLPAGTYDKIEKIYRQKQQFISLALTNRYDFQALKKYIDYCRIMLNQARNNLLPQFDLKLRTGYSGWENDSGVTNTFSPLFNNVPGASGGIYLNLLLPVPNNSAKGTLLQNQATLREYQIQIESNARSISSSVATQLFALKQRVNQLREAEMSVDYYEKSVRDVQKKFQLGMATLSDLLLIKDDLDTAISQKIIIQQQYANALATLRYNTATLIRFNGREGQIEVGDLVEIPDISEFSISSRQTVSDQTGISLKHHQEK